MTYTFQDLEDAQAKRHDICARYVQEIASTDSRSVREQMAKVWTTWAKWVRDVDTGVEDDGVKTDWTGPIDYLDREGGVLSHMGRACQLTWAYAHELVMIDVALLTD